ncbi:MAG: hypothetical protein OXC06_11260 [Acidimicrobiaceae bacterium]|nr:hypothetical protein [Acidimicrobiaceae bacterium]
MQPSVARASPVRAIVPRQTRTCQQGGPTASSKREGSPREIGNNIRVAPGTKAEIGSAGGRIVGIEIKASASVGRSDARHLEWLSGIMGDRFAGGVVLHTGPDTFELADRIIAAPISTLWT